jgi:hypothetical protein
VTKEERRRLAARRKLTRIKRTKVALIGTLAVMMPLLFFLATQR